MKKAIIDLTDCKYIMDLHERIRVSLDFPDWYGKNWSAFWDCLSVDCEYNFITVTGESRVADILKESVAKMNELLERNRRYWHGQFDYEIID